MAFHCDWCGELIEDRRGLMALDISGRHTDGRYIYVRRHFHGGSSADDDSCLLRALAFDEHRSGDEGGRPRTAKEVQREVKQVWKTTPRERRESLLFQVLGDGRLVIREMTDRMNRELGIPEGERYGGRAVYEGEVRSLATRLLRDGQLDREAETFNKTHMRYRYFRRRELEGPIAELEQAYQDEPDGEVA